MTLFSLDVETRLIRPGRQAPGVVAAGVQVQGQEPHILLRDDALDFLEHRLAAGDTWVNHRTAYDAACAVATRPALFEPICQAYESDQVECTQVRELLIRIAQGTSKRYPDNSLAELVRRHRIPGIEYAVDAKGKKAEEWRLRYHELDGVPVRQWPEDARTYLLKDARAPLAVYEAQARYPASWLVDRFRQSRADFLLYLVTCWGCRVDQRTREALAEILEAEIRAAGGVLRAAGLVRSDGTKDMKAVHAFVEAECARLKVDCPRTDTGAVSTEKDSLAEIPDDRPDDQRDTPRLLDHYVTFISASKTRQRLERLRRAGGLPVQVRYEVLKETGRTSAKSGDVKPGQSILAYGDAQQNLDRKPGLRECYVPRPGHVLVSCDYSMGELHTWAQVCLWLGLDSRMAKLLNAGVDVHRQVGIDISGEDTKDARQGAKALDFGIPGGLGAEKLRLYAWKNYRVRFTPDEAKVKRGKWLDLFPESRPYFRHINLLLDSKAPQVFFKSGRVRGDVYYANAANGWFQGLLADCAKDAMWRALRAHLRIWGFYHDEIVIEVEEARAHESALLLQSVMESAGRDWCPDVPLRAPPAVMRRFRKGAEAAYRDGRLISWEDRDLKDKEIATVRELLRKGTRPEQVGWVVGIETERVLEVAA